MGLLGTAHLSQVTVLSSWPQFPVKWQGGGEDSGKKSGQKEPSSTLGPSERGRGWGSRGASSGWQHPLPTLVGISWRRESGQTHSLPHGASGPVHHLDP